ncbi:MAG: Ubiquinone biosynthesis O-methyltransferase [Anaerolineales bacterium]|nr:Ubiquinone biosynthesis O-methyltransferase [Anaerolineales bacterium]
MSTQCPYCSSKQIHAKWQETRFWRCDSCGLHFRNPMPTPQELEELYAVAWSDADRHRSGTGGTTEQLANTYAYALAKEIGQQDLRNLKIMDFGAGRGDFAKALQHAGADTTCVEPFGFDYLKEQGLSVQRGLDELPAHTQFDGIVMVDVWEHLTEPWKTMETFAGLLRSGGWLFIATPAPLGLNARVRGDLWREARKSVHLLFPEPRTLERMHKETGFASWKRLKWNVRYSDNPAVAAYQSLLQMTGLDGELRSLAWKA